MDNSIQVFFGMPKHGWLPVAFCHREFRLDFAASDVLNNPTQELYDTLMDLHRKKKAGEITWWLEPSAYFFRFERNDTQYALTISETDYWDNKNSERVVIKTIEGNYKQLIRPFIDALVEFSSQTYNEDHWPYSIDKFKIRQLTAGM